MGRIFSIIILAGLATICTASTAAQSKPQQSNPPQDQITLTQAVDNLKLSVTALKEHIQAEQQKAQAFKAAQAKAAARKERLRQLRLPPRPVIHANARYQRMITAAIGKGNSQAKLYFKQVQDKIVFTVFSPYKKSICGEELSSCVIWSDTSEKAIIYLNTNHMNRPGNFKDHVIWHEIGHVYEYYRLDPHIHNMAARRLKQRAAWPKITYGQRSGVKTPVHEALAEFWTMWALSIPKATSAYHVPKVFTDKEFGRLLAHYQLRIPN